MNRFGLHFLFLFGFTATVYPYFPLFLKARGFDERQIGLLLGCLNLAGVIGPLAIGLIVDRAGRLRTLLLASIILSVIPIIPLTGISLFWLAVPLVFLSGAFSKAVIPLADALVCNQMEDTAHQYGRARAIGSLGFVLTLLAIRAFKLVNEDSSSSMLLAMLIMSAATLFTVMPLAPVSRTPGTAPASLLRLGGFDRGFWIWIGVIFLSRFGMVAQYSFFALYLRQDLNIQFAAWVVAVGAAAEIPIIFFAGKWIRRFGLPTLMAVSLVASVVRLVSYGFIQNFPALIAIQLLHGLCFGAFHVATIEFINRKAPPHRRGIAMSIYMAVGLGLSGLVGSVLGGYIINFYGYQNLFLLYAAMPLAALAMLLILRSRLNIPAAAQAQNPPPENPIELPDSSPHLDRGHGVLYDRDKPTNGY